VALAVCVGLVLATVGTADAVKIRGTLGSDRIVGTPVADALFGLAGNDRVRGLGGPDLLDGGDGRDQLFAGPGLDLLVANGDRSKDEIACGAGRDIVNADLIDSVGPACEVVSRQLSTDPYFDREGQHETQVEPDSFAVGSTIVTVFQVARYVDGGAQSIGYATSRDAGATWQAGQLPGLTVFSTPRGTASAVSDPVIAYDAGHRTWLAASLALTDEGETLYISRSPDGVRWSLPVNATPGESNFDKEWIACDNWTGSPLRGSCYLSYYETKAHRIETRASRDGGLTWSAGVFSPDAAAKRFVNGAQPLIRPDGTLVVVYSHFAAYEGARDHLLEAIRSTDGGRSFGAARKISELHGSEYLSGLRAPQFVSGDVDAAGRLYIAWHDCRFDEDCAYASIGFTTSATGVNWTEPARIPTGANHAVVEEFVPGLAVDPTTRGRNARVAVAYHRHASCGTTRCVDVELISSADGGATWGRAQRLNARPMPISWIADTALGAMLADYISTSYVRGRPIPVFALASEPTGDILHQAIFATTRVTEPRP
jgi:hypothetical protein